MIFTSNNESTKNHDEDISVEDMALLTEAALLESSTDAELEELLSNKDELDELLDEEIVTERTIVRLDKQARVNQQQKVAVFTIAKEKNDPKFKKLMTVWRLERYLEAELFKKYGNEGLRRAKKSVHKQSLSKSGLVKRAANNTKKQLGIK